MDGFDVTTTDTQVLGTFDDMPDAVLRALHRRCSILALRLEAKVKRKLTGDVLNVVTGALRRSIHTDVEIDASGVTAEVASSGDVKYAARHEFGFDGIEEVSGHVREITQMFGQPLKESIMAYVKPFSRQAHTPERSFMRTSLAEMEPEIVIEMQDAIMEGMGE